MYGAAWSVLVSGIQLKTFCRLVGFDNLELSLLAAAPPLANCGMLLGAILIERTGLRKYQFLEFGIMHRLLWMVIAALPLLLRKWPSQTVVYAVLIVYALSWFLQSFASPAWTTWMGDLVPKRIRGRYFASRFGFARMIQVVIVIAIGKLLDNVTAAGADGKPLPETAQFQPMLLYVIMGIFAVAALLGAWEILMYRGIREIVPKTPQAKAADMRFVDVLKDRDFLWYVIYGFTITFAAAVPGMYFWVYTTERLGFSKLAVNVLYMVISPILGMIGLKVWGRLLDRWGRRPVLMVATFMTVFSVTPYFFSTPHTPWPQIITTAVNAVAEVVGPYIHSPAPWITPDMPVGAYLVICCSVIIGGIGWTGIMMGQNNFTLGFSDRPGRSKLVASAGVLVSLGAIIGAPVGGCLVWLIETYLPGVWVVGPFIWTCYHATFAVSFLFRIAAVLLLVKMPDPGAGKVGDMVRYVGLAAYSQLGHWFLFPVRFLVRKRDGG